MNKRIQELAEESGLAYLSSVHPNMWEKFADLIIKECILMAIDPQCFPKDHLTLEEAFRAGQEHSMLCIKEHFGVE